MRPLFLAILLLLSAASTAVAHAELARAVPGPGDVVRTVPRELVARFTQNLDARRSSMSLRSATNAVLAQGRVTGAREMRMALPRLAAGTYTVRWTTYSTEDAEIARGTYTFRVVATSSTPTAAPTVASSTPSPTAASPSPTPAPSSGNGSAASVVLPVVVALAVVGLLAVRLLRRR